LADIFKVVPIRLADNVQTVPGVACINGMLFLRGHRSSYDQWAEQGAKGWRFEDLLPYFRPGEVLGLIPSTPDQARIAGAPALAPFTTDEALPGPATDDAEAVHAYLKKRLRTYFHYTGTCRMGTDHMSVVDPADLRVHGLTGLRVADASVMPSIVPANTNATVYAIAERAAELMGVTRP
jgi:choline dehydrogenase-like flavoprotein